MEQIDGGKSESDSLDDDEDKYLKTSEYSKHGKDGTVLQTLLDIVVLINNSDLTKESKKEEKAKVLASRKHTFGSDFDIFPPWNSK